MINKKEFEFKKIWSLIKRDWDRLKGAVNRGGNWNNGANAGLFYANLNNEPSNSNTNIGFRCCNSLRENFQPDFVFSWKCETGHLRLHQSNSRLRSQILNKNPTVSKMKQMLIESCRILNQNGVKNENL